MFEIITYYFLKYNTTIKNKIVTPSAFRMQLTLKNNFGKSH